MYAVLQGGLEADSWLILGDYREVAKSQPNQFQPAR